MLGLTSITFRKLSVEEILQRTVRVGLKGIEWGSDIHVPATDLDHARHVGALTREAGLAVTSYGSYYRLGAGEDFKAYADAARALETPLIRIWAGTQGSAAVSTEVRRAWVKDARRAAEIAEDRGLTIGFEYHPGTLTDDSASAVALMEEIDRSNCRLYWQPNFAKPMSVITDGLLAARPWLCAVHVFYWDPAYRRLPMVRGKELWQEWFTLAPETRSVPCLLEFVPDDDPACLSAEADGLRAAALTAWRNIGGEA